MLKNYLKIAWRNLIRKKGYAAINIIGLAAGLAACLQIGLYVQDELSYDDFHEEGDRIYRVLREFDIPELKITIDGTPSALAPAIEQSVSGIEAAVRVRNESPIVEHGTQKFVEPSFISAGVGFFEIFSFPMLSGKASLDRPGTIVISKSMAKKYFQDENPVRKTLSVGNKKMEVTGVIADVPANSHLQFNFVASLDEPEPSWDINNFTTYVLLQEGQQKNAVTSQIAERIRQNAGARNSGSDFIPHLQPISGIHLGQGVSVEIGSQGNILYIYLFIALAAFILLLACINFMNLATARSVKRGQEVGVRKTLGAGRGQLIMQFLGESVLMTVLALVLALVICQLTLPFLNELAGKSLAFSALYSGSQVLVLIGLTLFVGLLAGIYPAFILSGFKPLKVLKGSDLTGQSKKLRRGLVVFQFAISIALLVGTGVVLQQLRFMKSTGLGFDPENVVLIEQTNFLDSQAEPFKEQLATLPGTENVSSGFSMPGTIFINSMWRPANADGELKNVNYTFVDFGYTETLDIRIIAGRSLSQSFGTDSLAVILNEAAVQDFGWSPEEAIRHKITRGGEEYAVVGVAKNFHYQSLRSKIAPAALFGPRRTPRYVAVRIKPNDVPGTLDAFQKTWKQFSNLPFEYTFLADKLAAQYRTEDRLAGVFSVFAGLAILIGCLGLFGLAAYTAQRRTKEIGIRKVLGASVANIVGLLSKDFLKLVTLGFVIAVPIAWYVMNQWLTNFAYKIEIGPCIFLLAGALALLIALSAVSWQSIRAALANPVDSLRSE